MAPRDAQDDLSQYKMPEVLRKRGLLPIGWAIRLLQAIRHLVKPKQAKGQMKKINLHC